MQSKMLLFQFFLNYRFIKLYKCLKRYLFLRARVYQMIFRVLVYPQTLWCTFLNGIIRFKGIFSGLQSFFCSRSVRYLFFYSTKISTISIPTVFIGSRKWWDCSYNLIALDSHSIRPLCVHCCFHNYFFVDLSFIQPKLWNFV